MEYNYLLEADEMFEESLEKILNLLDEKILSGKR